MKVCVSFADSFEKFPLFIDPTDLSGVFQIADTEHPDVLIYLHSKSDFLTRADFHTSRNLLLSIFKYGVTADCGIVGSRLSIAEKCSNNSTISVTLDTPTPIKIIVTNEISSIALNDLSNETTVHLICLYGQQGDEWDQTDSVERVGLVSVAGLEDPGTDAGCNVRFFLSRPPKECEVNTLTLGGIASSVIDFKC